MARPDGRRRPEEPSAPAGSGRRARRAAARHGAKQPDAAPQLPGDAVPGAPAWVAPALPVLAAVLLYLPALHNGFIWDDPTVLLQLRAIQSLRDLFVPPAIIPKFYFRPVIFTSYLIDRFLGGETPFWFHASVIGWHALDTWLVYVLARRLVAEPASTRLVASSGALLFAVFPTHVESVAWMAGRSDVIVGAFVLATVLLFMEQEHAWSAWLGGLVFFAAMLSKETAIACVVLVPLLDLLRDRRVHLGRYLPLVLASAGYFLLRRHALGVTIGGTATGAAPVALALDLLRAVGFYVAHAVVPAPLCGYIPEIPANPLYLCIGIGALALAVGLGILAWARGRWQPVFLVAWFFLTLAPSLTVIVRRSASAVVADRYLYVPTVASCVLIAWGLVRLAEWRRVPQYWAAVAVGALCVACVAEAAPYIHVWTDNYTFWSDVAAKVPDEAMPHREVAAALQARGQLQAAERELQLALAGKSDRDGRATTYNNLGNLYRRMKRYGDAETALDTAISIVPNPGFYHNLGMALMLKVEEEQRQGDRAGVLRDIIKARDALETALRLGSEPGAARAFPEWNSAKTHALLGQVLFSLGDRAGARVQLETALRLDPNGPVADLTRRYLQRMPP